MAKLEALDAFITTLKQFIEAIRESYADCKATQATYAQLMAYLKVPGAKKVIIETFHESMRSYYAEVSKGNLGSFKPGSIEILDQVHFMSKWEAADAETREVITEYVQQLCKLSQTWSVMNKMPPELTRKITGIAQKVAAGIESGEGIDLAGIDLQSLGEEAKKNVDPAEIMALAQSLQADGSLQHMLGALQKK